jgi:periplasmic divalent cation tolerance protein
MSLATLYMTAPSREEAERIGRRLLEERLGILSPYWWNGAIQREPEALLLAKTQMHSAQRCIDMIKQIHPYEVPCVTILPVAESLAAYRQWVEQETGGAEGERK